VINRGEIGARAQPSAVLSEIVAVELLPIVNGEGPRNPEPAYDLLPQEFMHCPRGYVHQRSGFYPSGEILNYHCSKTKVALSCGQRSDQIYSPLLQRLYRSDELQRLRGLVRYRSISLTAGHFFFTSCACDIMLGQEKPSRTAFAAKARAPMWDPQ
jgi:hypothetical protein